ncbi:MAG: MFS transporter, partial [Acidimicrobiales bacterium]
MTAGIERNLKLVSAHKILASSYVWIPVMVLLTRARFGLEDAIILSAVYYLFVVVIEVPSGWMSDRFGRVLTLRIAAASWMVAHTFFAFGGERLWMFVVGQALMAVGFASLSGTDVSFHYDSLEALDRASEYPARESRVASRGYIATTAAAVTGGAIGLIDLEWPFILAALLAAAQFILTFRLTEPPAGDADRFIRHVGRSARYLREPMLGWLFFYGIVMVTLEHVAFTPLQPWLTEALGETASDVGSTPLVSGLVIASFSLIGSLAARHADHMGRRLGVPWALISLGVLSAVIISTMAASTHLVVLAVIAFRSVQGAASPILLSSSIAPRTAREHRATLLSLNSLAGRLGYGLILLTVA